MKSDTSSEFQSINPPTTVKIVRECGQITEQEAEAYASALPRDAQISKSGCYVYKCAKGFLNGLPVGVGCQVESGDGCMCFPVSTIPFMCCVCLCLLEGRGTYRNIKGDTMVAKVDEERGTMACFTRNCGGPCCYCYKLW